MDASVERLEVQVPESELLADVPWAPVQAGLLATGQRRLEARTYLTDGYGIRQRLASVVGATVQLSVLADVWQPSRLKGFTVRDGAGLPFLSAGQVFEARPRVRKWLSRALTDDPESRYVDRSWLLLSRSGDVGKLTAVYPEHVGKVITDDLLRIVPRSSEDYGWLYAYLRTPSFYAISRSSQYGHMIKHLEPEHVQQMPVPVPDAAARRIGAEAKRALEMRVDSRALQDEADRLYGRLVNPDEIEIGEAVAQTISARDVVSGRRRLDGQYHRADVRDIETLVRAAGVRRVDRLSDVTESVALGSRFKRFFGPEGTPYRSAGELFDVNAPVTKRVYSSLLADASDYMLHAGWIIMACSGQTYGLLGRSMVLTDHHEGIFGSHDLIRLVPDESQIRTGYLQTVLSHPDYGRPLVVRNAFGTSVPHLDPVDIRTIPIPRVSEDVEAAIANLCDESVRLSAEADRIETQAIDGAELLVKSIMQQHGRGSTSAAADNGERPGA